MIKVAVTGYNGLVGARVGELLSHDVEFIPLPHQQCDVTNPKDVQNCLKTVQYDILLHMAAYTNVDGAEVEKDQADALNVDGVRNVYEAVLSRKKKMILMSTDFVFSGQDGPYYEDSTPNPVGYYGASKYRGEKILDTDAMIVRIAYPYGFSPASKTCFVRTLRSLLEQKKQLKMVTDSLFTPTHIDDVAYAVSYLIHHFSPEIFHIVGSECLSPYEAGIQIAKVFGLDKELIQQTSYEDYFKGKAKRPQYSDVRSRKNTFYTMKTFQEGITRMSQE